MWDLTAFYSIRSMENTCSKRWSGICISFLQLYQNATNWWLLKKNVFFHKSGGQNSETEVLAWPPSLKVSRGEFFLASSSFWWFLAFLGLWQRNSNVCLCVHMAFFLLSLCSNLLLLSLIKISMHLRPTLIWYDLIWPDYIGKNPFPNKVTITGTRV